MRYSSPCALSVVRRPSASAQRGSVEGVDAAVDLAHRALGVVGVLLLDDRDDVTGGGVAQHPAVARGVVEHGGEHGGASRPPARGVSTSAAASSAVSSGVSPATTSTRAGASSAIRTRRAPRARRARRARCRSAAPGRRRRRPARSAATWAATRSRPWPDDDHEVLGGEARGGGEDVAEERCGRRPRAAPSASRTPCGCPRPRRGPRRRTGAGCSRGRHCSPAGGGQGTHRLPPGGESPAADVRIRRTPPRSLRVGRSGEQRVVAVERGLTAEVRVQHGATRGRSRAARPGRSGQPSTSPRRPGR